MIATTALFVALASDVVLLPREHYKQFVRDATRLHISEIDTAFALGANEYARITGRLPEEKK